MYIVDTKREVIFQYLMSLRGLIFVKSNAHTEKFTNPLRKVSILQVKTKVFNNCISFQEPNQSNYIVGCYHGETRIDRDEGSLACSRNPLSGRDWSKWSIWIWHGIESRSEAILDGSKTQPDDRRIP